MAISTFKPEMEFYFSEENCHIIEIHNHSEDNDCSIVRVRVVPGKTTQWHALQSTAERYVILEGSGIVEVGMNPPVAVKPLDAVLIPPGARQRIANTGQTDLIFLAICTPRFQPDAYVDLSSEFPEQKR